MEIELSGETQRLLEEQMATGRYPSHDAAIRAALEALMELETATLDAETLDAIDRAEARLERGEFYEWKDVRERVRAKFLGGGQAGGSE